MKFTKIIRLNYPFIPPVFVFIFTFLIYLLTLSRSIYPGDSGEFIAVAKTLGIAHPPGYPLYTLIAHLFTYLPFGNLAFKVNLFSAVTSSLTCVVIYFVCLKLTRNRLASISASLFLAFSYLFWLYSLVAEVFSLNNLFVAAIILISLYIFENPKNLKLWYLLSFIFGLSLTNHHTILFLTPALILLILSTNPKLLLNSKFIILNSAFLLIGLFPYLYLPLRAFQDPILNWGDPDTLEKFLHVLLRRDYGTFTLSKLSTQQIFNPDLIRFYFASLPSSFSWLGGVLGILGFYFLILTNKKTFLFLFLSLIFAGPLFVILSGSPVNTLQNGILERFLLSSQTIFAIFIGIGLVTTMKASIKYFKTFYLLIAFIFLLPLISHFYQVNQNKNYLYEEYGRKTFQTLPVNSVVFVEGDMLFMIAEYLQIAEGERPDLKFINTRLFLDEWYKVSLKKRYQDFSFPYNKFQPKMKAVEAGEIICQEVLVNYPTFTENETVDFETQNNKYCTNRPYQYLWKLEPKNYEISAEHLINEYENFWKPQISQLSQKKFKDLKTRTILLSKYSAQLTNLGLLLEEKFVQKDIAHEIYQDAYTVSADNWIALYLSARKYISEENFETAEKIEKQAIKMNPRQTEPYKILGLLNLQWKQDKKTALEYFKKYLKYAEGSAEKEQIKKLVAELERLN